MLEKYILENFDMRPKALIDELDSPRAPSTRRRRRTGTSVAPSSRGRRRTAPRKIADDLLRASPKGARTNGKATPVRKPTKRSAVAEA